jgi:hypothetical protein
VTLAWIGSMMSRKPRGGDNMSEQAIFEHNAPLPSGDGSDGVVHWHVFRDPDLARQFVPSIRLSEGQILVGGRTEDSVGSLWWLGVRVDDIERWGNRRALNKHAASD